MSGDGLEDLWLWDDRGDRAYLEGRLNKSDLSYYSAIQELRKKAKCKVCGELARFRYAPWTSNPFEESDRWACEKHLPASAVDGGMAEWDEYEWL